MRTPIVRQVKATGTQPRAYLIRDPLGPVRIVAQDFGEVGVIAHISEPRYARIHLSVYQNVVEDLRVAAETPRSTVASKNRWRLAEPTVISPAAAAGTVRTLSLTTSGRDSSSSV